MTRRRAAAAIAVRLGLTTKMILDTGYAVKSAC